MNSFEKGLDTIIDRGLKKSESNNHTCPYCGKEKRFATLNLFGKSKIVPIVCCEWEKEKDSIRAQFEDHTISSSNKKQLSIFDFYK